MVSEIFSQKIINKILDKIEKNADYSYGIRKISPRELRRVIGFTLSRKEGVIRINRQKQNEIIKVLQNSGKIKYICPSVVVVNPNTKIN
jgi:hypothetical protein